MKNNASSVLSHVGPCPQNQPIVNAADMKKMKKEKKSVTFMRLHYSSLGEVGDIQVSAYSTKWNMT